MSYSDGPAESGQTPLTADALAAIAAREQAATPGPWCTDGWEIYCGAEYVAGATWVGETCDPGDVAKAEADAEFTAHARQDVPALLAEVHRLRTELEERTAHLRRVQRIAQNRTAEARGREKHGARLEAELAAARELAGLAAEYRVQGPHGTAVSARLHRPSGRWQVVDASPRGWRALLPSGWERRSLLADDELAAWPDAATAVAAARRALGGGGRRG